MVCTISEEADITPIAMEKFIQRKATTTRNVSMRQGCPRVWNAVLTYIQLFEDIFKYLKISSNRLKISSNRLKISSNI